MIATTPRAPAERIASIIDLLCRALGGKVTRPGRPGLPDVLLVLIWNRLKRLGGRITRLAAKIEAGIPPSPPRRRAPRTKAPSKPPPAAPPARLPRDRGWLVRLVGYNAAAGTSQLEHLLAQPEMATLLADPRMARLLRPLCHLLGATPPPEIAKPPPAVAAPPAPSVPARSPPATAPQAAPPPRKPPPMRRPRPATCGPPPLPA